MNPVRNGKPAGGKMSSLRPSRMSCDHAHAMMGWQAAAGTKPSEQTTRRRLELVRTHTPDEGHEDARRVTDRPGKLRMSIRPSICARVFSAMNDPPQRQRSRWHPTARHDERPSSVAITTA